MGYKDPVKQREYTRKWMAARRKAWLDENGPCVRCGSSDQLEVDHIDPSQKITHNVWSWTKEKRDVELAKCQVLCSDCHKQKTRDEGPQAQHGTNHMYDKGCRCEPCRHIKSIKNAKRIRKPD